MIDPTPTEILSDLLNRYEGTVAVEAWGETSLFYNPGKLLPRGVYFATIKQKDGANDQASHLDRKGVFRLNAGTSKALFRDMFGPPPARPAKGCAVVGPWDFTKLNTPTPHPVYGWMSWIAVLNPTADTLETLRPVIDAAYEKAVTSFGKRTS